MLIPLADVPRWYADHKPKDTIAISHGADALSWEQWSAAPTAAPVPCR
jgi:bile acid-coenzyme A ligase